MWVKIKLQLIHALKYKPYQFHDRVIYIQYGKEFTVREYKFKHIRFKGFVQFAHFTRTNGVRPEGLMLSSYDKGYDE